MVENLESGFVVVRKQRKPILWTGQYAQHLAEVHYEEPSLHPLLHLKAQQYLAKAEVVSTKSGYIGYYEFSGGVAKIPVILKRKFVIIKTCYVMKTSKSKAMGLGKLPEPIEWPKEAIKRMIADGLYQTEAEAIETLNYLRRVYHRRKARASGSK